MNSYSYLREFLKRQPILLDWLKSFGTTATMLGAVQGQKSHVYRPDIDGLRAIAVLAVVFYHAGAPVPGGFIGVDVFFVISGYLITLLIEGDIAKGAFSIASFYERRIRRIFPALFAMMFASFAVACYIFMPPELALFAKSAIASSVFVSNILFWSEAGYFDTVAEFKPLLHTWSLSVEEQFYVFFPLLLVVLERFAKGHKLLVLSLVVAVSFLLNVWWVTVKPEAGFYLLPSRFWELGIGGMLALHSGSGSGNATRQAFLAGVGLVMIAVAAFGFDSKTPFPGLAALSPCLGAAFVIFAGQSANPVNKVLSAAPFVWVGLVSYSLYLLHWPLIIFAQYQMGRHLHWREMALVLLASLTLAALSWRLIERPFRKRAILPKARSLFVGALFAALVCIGCGIVVVIEKGLPSRLPDNVLAAYNVRDDRSPLGSEKCFTSNNGKGPTDKNVRAAELCTFGSTEGTSISVLLWGDSHAAALAPAIEAAAGGASLRGAIVGMGSCPPLINYVSANTTKAKREACILRNAAVMGLIRDKKIPIIVLVARWPREVLGAEFGNEGPYFDPLAPQHDEDRSVILARALEETFTALAQLKTHIILVHDVPEPGYDVPVALARSLLRGQKIDVNPRRGVVDARRALALMTINPIAAKYGVDVVDPIPSLCDSEYCRAEIGDVPLYVDSDHLTLTASRSLHYLFDSLFAGLAVTIEHQPVEKP